MKKMFSLILLSVFLFGFISSNISLAATSKDEANGVYTDNFSNNAGFPTRSYVNANTGTGVLQLTNTSSQTSFVAPYRASGTAMTAEITPLSLALLGSLTFDAVIPLNTTLKVQLCDRNGGVIPDTVLSGNVAGFQLHQLI